LFLDGKSVTDAEFVTHGHEDERGIPAGLLADRRDLRYSLDSFADVKRLVEADSAPRPEASGEGDRRKKVAAPRVTVRSEIGFASDCWSQRPMKAERGGVALARRISGVIERRVPRRHAARGDPIRDALCFANPLPEVFRDHERDSRVDLRRRQGLVLVELLRQAQLLHGGVDGADGLDAMPAKVVRGGL